MMTGRQPEWLPLDLPVTPPVADLIERKTGTRDAAAAFHLDFCGVGLVVEESIAAWRAAYAELGVPLPANAEFGWFGNVEVKPPAASVGQAYHFRQQLHPLQVIQSVEQLHRLPWPDPARFNNLAQVQATVQQAHAAGRVVIGDLWGTVFELAWYLRGMDYLFSDLIEGNGIGDWLLDWMMNRSIQAGVALAEAGVDVIGLGDDVGTQRGMMMSVEFWREHLQPRLKRVIDAIRQHQRHHVWIRYHSDGDIRLILDELAALGVDLLNPVQPECMPLATVIPLHQHHLGFWGMIGTQTTMPFGTPDDVRAAVAACAQYARAGARMVVGPTHVLEPDVPWENIVALVEAVRASALPASRA